MLVRTVKDAYPLPRIKGLLSHSQDIRYMSAIDLKETPWEIVLGKSSRAKTASTVLERPLHQFTVMPFGLCNTAR